MLKAAGAGAVALGTVACGNADAQVFAGAVAEPIETTTTEPPTTTTTSAAPSTTEAAEPQGPTTTLPDANVVGAAVNGSMVVSFTYTRVGPGKIESPYIAVWIESSEGDLLETVSLWYEQSRRGRRWIDHLDRWFAGDTTRVSVGGADVSATISSATRPPGEYAVTWDGLIAGVPAPVGDYFVCIESAREDGPYSLICEPIRLDGSRPQIALPDNGELSAASVRIDV